MTNRNNPPIVESCPDGHYCLHGSKCIKNPYQESNYYCDCDEVIFNVDYEGLHCEHKAEVYCTDRSDVNIQEHWFCTNGGVCQTIEGVGTSTSTNGIEWGCDCPDRYEGQYCQFVKGTVPKGWPFNDNGGGGGSGMTGNGFNVGNVVVGTIGVLIVIFGAIIIYKGRSRTLHVLDVGRDLELEADGSVLKDAVSKGMQDLDADGAILREAMELESSSKEVAVSSPREVSFDIDNLQQLNNNNRRNVNQERPDTRQSEGGISYAEESNIMDDNSMMSFT